MPYLLDDPAQIYSPVIDPHQISSDPEPDTDDWEDVQKSSPIQKSPALELEEINWDDINDEVNAAMNESDDDDDKSQRSGIGSGNTSEDDDWTDETNSAIR